MSREEFVAGLREIGIQISPSELDACINLCDTKKIGMVDFDEFLLLIRVI